MPFLSEPNPFYTTASIVYLTTILTVRLRRCTTCRSGCPHHSTSEAGPEAIIPLDRLGQFGGGGQVINLHVDGELLTQEVVKGMPAFIDARLGGI